MIWSPKFTFLNLKSFKWDGGMDGGRRFYVYDEKTWPEGNENLEIAGRFRVSVFCIFDFKNYPFDSQYCDFTIKDPEYTTDQMLINLKDLCYKGTCGYQNKPHSISKSHFNIRIEKLGTNNYTDYFGYTYSIRTIRLQLERKSLDLLIGSFYLPTGLFAFLSSASYIINPDHVITFFSILQVPT